jgi:hypothetical protein
MKKKANTLQDGTTQKAPFNINIPVHAKWYGNDTVAEERLNVRHIIYIKMEWFKLKSN